MIRYAGYKTSDGSIIGDPDSVEFTEVREGFVCGCVPCWCVSAFVEVMISVIVLSTF